ncbi:MAG: hypothetical protein AAC990_05010 [Dehalococcoides mccartyi]|uniref:hypothetical protein n=1 Tax=Dehalococcoides mccartyi TaxID=61435 RepID=UPI0030FA8593
MPRRYVTKKILTNNLKLDPENPRFVSITDISQGAIIKYLLEYEEVLELALSINAYGGLMPGEFPITFNDDNNETVVLEGNRRVCACKILLDPTIVPSDWNAKIPRINKSVRDVISKIEVHEVNSRDEAQIILGTRHIEGVKRWPSVAKFMFIAKHYENGKTVEEIKAITDVSIGRINTLLKNHYFLQYILSLSCWTDVEKQNAINYVQLHKIGVDRVLRIFTTNGSDVLKISYDDRFRPQSNLPGFEKIVEHIVRRVFGLLPRYTAINTRSSFESIIPDIQQWLPQNTSTNNMSNSNTSVAIPSIPVSSPQVIPPIVAVSRPSFYFENFQYNLSGNSDEEKALRGLCEEIKKISKGGEYRQLPLSAALLTRTLLEQACKRRLKQVNPSKYNELCQSGYDPSLTKILKEFCNNKNLLDGDATIIRQFNGLFPNGEGIKNIMDLCAHQTSLCMPTGATLENWASTGLKNVLEHLLK